MKAQATKEISDWLPLLGAIVIGFLALDDHSGVSLNLL